MTDRIGLRDQRRLIAGGIPNWGNIPFPGNPASRTVHGRLEKFGINQILADGAVPTVPGWLCQATTCVLTMSDVAGGALLATCGGADDDTFQMQLGDGVGGAFWPVADKAIWFETRVRQTILGTNELNMAFGLVDPVAANEILADAGGAAFADNRLYFYTRDTAVGVDQWGFEGDNAGATDTNLLGVNLESLVWHTYGFKVNGLDSVDVYYDRALVAAGAIATANIPVTGLTPFFIIKAGSAVAETMEVDYCMCIMEI